MADSVFSPQSLIPFLPADNPDCLVAFSGGMDSHVLLHALCRLKKNTALPGRIRAIHVNHGLSPDAQRWADHCQAVCQGLEVPLEIVSVTVRSDGKGLEDAARRARLAVFEERLEAGESLLTAHHLDDQMETLLFRFMRGTGLRGLAGIRPERSLGKGTVRRPLLAFSRAALKEYADSEALEWIEDQSNSDEALDRNFLRHKVIPLLASRWPGYRRNWQRLARLADEGQQLQEILGTQDLETARSGLHRLSITALLDLAPVRQRNALRTWFLSLERSHGVPAPDHGVVDRILSELVPAAEDAEPLVTWNKEDRQVEVRRFAGHIYLVLADPGSDRPTRLQWQPEQALELPGKLGTLRLVPGDSGGFELPAGPLEVAFREGGESAKPAGRKTRPLKKILQDYRVPPWIRTKLPLVYSGGELLAVADLFVCEGWQPGNSDTAGKKTFRIQWDRSELHCGY